MSLLFKAEIKSVICRSIQQMRPVCELVLPIVTIERIFEKEIEMATAAIFPTISQGSTNIANELRTT
jgi:hypothetical protein